MRRAPGEPARRAAPSERGVPRPPGGHLLRLLSVVLLALVSSWTLASDAAAQGVVRGHVVDSAGRTIGGARLRVLGSEQSAVAADDGSFRLALPSGFHLLRVGRLGFAHRTIEVELGADTLDVAIVLDPAPLQLPEVVVAASEERYASKLAGFVERRRTSAAPPGTFYTRRDLEQRPPLRLSDLLPRADQRCATRRLMIWYDGMLLAPGTHMDTFSVQEVEALELYRSVSHLPPQFNASVPGGGTPGCVLLIWSR